MTKTRKKTVRLPLTVAGPGLVMPGMTAEQLKVGSCFTLHHIPEGCCVKGFGRGLSCQHAG